LTANDIELAANAGGTDCFVYWFKVIDDGLGSIHQIYVASDESGKNESILTVTYVPYATKVFTITVNAGAGGAVTGGGAFAEDADVVLTATPNTGYSFDGWYENNVRIAGANAVYNFAATEDRVLQARFALQSTGDSRSSGGSGSVSGSGGILAFIPEQTPIEEEAVEIENTETPLSASGVSETDDYINPYNDVAISAWYYKAVKYVTQGNIMIGTGEGKFSPDMPITRAMFAQIIYNYSGKPAITINSPFDDVLPDSWYYNAVVWASSKGIVAGYGNNLFGPDDLITREQMAVLLYNFAKSLGIDVEDDDDLSGYTDADIISEWARPAIGWAVSNGVIKGRTSETIVPDGNATRAEAATLLMQFIELVIK
jgi:hypothetical protein